MGTPLLIANDPAVLPTVVTISQVPPNIPAGESFNATAEIDVHDYTPRNIEWSTNFPDKVTITAIDDSGKNVRVELGGTLQVNDEVVISCTIDGIKGDSGLITIISG
jgi:hypothetical protein